MSEDLGATRIAQFHRLHESGTFVMPNPWDAGSAVMLQRLGFPALASTSAGAAWAAGRPDNGLALERALAHLRDLVAAVSVPVNADFEGAYAVDPSDVHAHVTLACGTGVAGLSVEDSSQNPEQPLCDFALAVDRVAAARQAIDDSGTGVLLTARSEGFVVGRPDLDTRRSAGCRPSPRQERTVCMHRGSPRPRRSPPWSRRSHPSR